MAIRFFLGISICERGKAGSRAGEEGPCRAGGLGSAPRGTARLHPHSVCTLQGPCSDTLTLRTSQHPRDRRPPPLLPDTQPGLRPSPPGRLRRGLTSPPVHRMSTFALPPPHSARGKAPPDPPATQKYRHGGAARGPPSRACRSRAATAAGRPGWAPMGGQDQKHSPRRLLGSRPTLERKGHARRGVSSGLARLRPRRQDPALPEVASAVPE